MYPMPQIHTEVARFVHADRTREAERHAQVAAALGKGDTDDEVHGVLSRLAAFVPSARLSLRLAAKKPVSDVA